MADPSLYAYIYIHIYIYIYINAVHILPSKQADNVFKVMHSSQAVRQSEHTSLCTDISQQWIIIDVIFPHRKICYFSTLSTFFFFSNWELSAIFMLFTDGHGVLFCSLSLLQLNTNRLFFFTYTCRVLLVFRGGRPRFFRARWGTPQGVWVGYRTLTPGRTRLSPS